MSVIRFIFLELRRHNVPVTCGVFSSVLLSRVGVTCIAVFKVISRSKADVTITPGGGGGEVTRNIVGTHACPQKTSKKGLFSDLRRRRRL